MKFETIRSKKKILLIGIILFCVSVTLILATSLAAYKKTTTIKIAEGTVNYIIPDFKMIALKQWNEEIGEYEDVGVMPSGSEYVISEDSYCEVLGEKDENVVLYTDSKGQHVISNIQKKSKCYLYFEKRSTGSKYILANSKMRSGTPNFANTSCTSGSNNGGHCREETVGLYCWDIDTNESCTSSSENKTYFYRGNVKNNYVKFAGFYWRIIRINENGSIRMIYQGRTKDDYGNELEIQNVGDETQLAETSSFNTDYNRAEYVGFKYELENAHGTDDKSTILSALETWYANELQNYEEYLDTESGFCGDRSAYTDTSGTTAGGGTGSTRTYYGTYTRLCTNKAPSFKCSDNGNDLYKTKIGLITADEVAYAGGTNTWINYSYYLYTGNLYWTLSPGIFDGSYANVFLMGNTGGLDFTRVQHSYGVRPVINLSADNLIILGSGLAIDPYVIS